jgi:hypothetical protein
MFNYNSFIESCSRGELLLDDIDDCIDQWHESESELELHEYLGMTQHEYILWVHDPEVLVFIITARMQNKSIDEIIPSHRDLRMAARATSPEVAKLGTEWLNKRGI